MTLGNTGCLQVERDDHRLCRLCRIYSLNLTPRSLYLPCLYTPWLCFVTCRYHENDLFIFCLFFQRFLLCTNYLAPSMRKAIYKSQYTQLSKMSVIRITSSFPSSGKPFVSTILIERARRGSFLYIYWLLPRSDGSCLLRSSQVGKLYDQILKWIGQ